MTITALPQVIAGILTNLNAAQSLKDLEVVIYDGPEVDNSYPGDWIGIGHNGSEDGEISAGQGQNSWRGLGAKRMEETATIDCIISTWDGDTDVAAKRVRAYAILSAVDTIIRSDPSFGGACLFGGLNTHELTYWQSTAGFGVRINFSITYEART